MGGKTLAVSGNFKRPYQGRRCLRVAKNEEDGFILRSQDLPITVLLRAGVAKPTAQLGDCRRRPKAISPAPARARARFAAPLGSHPPTDKEHHPASLKRRELHIYVLRRDGLRVPHAARIEEAVQTSFSALHEPPQQSGLWSDSRRSLPNSWGTFCDVTLTLKQARQPDSGASEDDKSRKNFQSFLKSPCNAREYSMEVRSDPFESAKSQHFVDTAKGFVYYPYLKKARSAPAPYVHGTVARQVDGTFIAQLNCPRTSTVLPLKS